MKKKLCVVSLIILIVINILSMAVSALSFTTTMTPSNTKIEPGTEVVISVKVTNLDVGEDGINTFSAILGYDTSVFEILTEANVEGSSNWKSAYATGTGKITLTKTDFTNSDQEIMQITLKVKNTANEGSKGTVSLTNVLAASPESEISSSNVSTTITVGNGSGSNPNDDPNRNSIISNITITNNTTNNINNNTVNNTVNNVANNTQNRVIPSTNNIVNNTSNGTIGSTNENIEGGVENQVDGDMPYTGSESTAIIQIIIGIIIIALLIYRKIYLLEDI